MAVLKSLELNGNKQSFASWISNLSPCETPFASMIGKDSISQAQYSWQVDSLAPPAHPGYDEGSNVEFPVRRGTDVLQNYTSTLRKVVNISDTAERIALHGRASEMNYQMSKAGKELMRDVEFMCLNNKLGNAGTKAVASKFSGFYGLCVDPDFVDPDTGAKTVKRISVADQSSPWFSASDLFDLTYNLYLAGSKANKIMFHPRHALTFSQFMSKNVESPKTYRMFDGLDDKFNMKVSSVRDPLSQKYDLIPNRFMPEDMIYVFNESDWTQTILRQPAVSPLGRKGSAERYLMETEIGLRHKNPQASGVLVMDPSNLLVEWISKPTPMTWGIDRNEEAIISIKIRSTGALVPNGTEVKWSSSNPLIVEIADPEGHTADGKANVLLKPLRVGTSVITATTAEGSASYLATVGNPNIKLRMSSNQVEKGKKTLAVVAMTHADGSPVKDGIVVSFDAQPGHLVNMPARTSPTAGGSGTAQVEVNAADELGIVQVHASVGNVRSNYAKLEIVDKVEALGMAINRNNIAYDVNDKATLQVFVWDATGSPIANQDVKLRSSNTRVVNIANNDISTGATGTYVLVLTASGIGSTTIVAEYKGQVFEIPVTIAAPKILLAGPGSYQVGTEFSMTATVKRTDDTVLSGIEIDFFSAPAFTSGSIQATTDANGVATAKYTSLNNSDMEVTASAGQTNSNSIVIHGPNLVGGVWREPEMLTRPIAIGGKSNAKIVLSGKDGMPLKDAVVTWEVEPAGIVTAANLTTTTDLNGMSLLELTGVSKGVGKVSFHCEGDSSKPAHFHVGQGTTKSFLHSPLNPKVNENIVFTSIIRRDEDNAPVSGADVTFTCDDAGVGGFPVTVKTNASGVASFENFFPDAGVYKVTSTAPEYSHVEITTVTVVPPDTSVDTPYVMTFVGANKRVTHDTNQTITITTKTMLWGSAAMGVRLDVRSLDPHIAVATLNDAPSTNQGNHTFTVKGFGPGVARIQFKARNNAGGWIDVPITVVSPTLEVIVSPTTMSAGTTVEIAAVYKNGDGEWVPGMGVRWEHPKTMFNGQQTMPVQTTDQFGRTFYSNRAGAWATHTFRAILVSNESIRSRDHSINVHM